MIRTDPALGRIMFSFLMYELLYRIAGELPLVPKLLDVKGPLWLQDNIVMNVLSIDHLPA